MRRYLVAASFLALLVAGFYAGSKIYKSFQPGGLTVCGFEPNQRIRVMSPKYLGYAVSKSVVTADSLGVAKFSRLWQGPWYVLDKEENHGWYQSEKFKDEPFYVVGMEHRNYNCSAFKRG